MVELTPKELKAGMYTATDVRTPRGQLIVNKNVELTPGIIKRLTFYAIKKVNVTDDSVSGTNNNPAVELVNNTDPSKLRPSRSQLVKTSLAFQRFQVFYTMNMGVCKDYFNSLLSGTHSVDMNNLLEKTVSILDKEKTNIEIIEMLNNMRHINDSIYAHSMNVAMMSRSIGDWVGISSSDLDVLTVAGFLHDIGKLRIPPSILNKPGILTPHEFDIVKEHTRMGHEILKDQPIDERIKEVALKHHERCDGSGYPLRLTSNDIDTFSSIVGIADIYDAMTAARPYHAPICPFAVIASFERDGLQKFDPHIILVFLKRIAEVHMNDQIMLNNGKRGNIVMLNEKHLSRPIVKLLDGTFVDLSQKSDLHITGIV